MSVNVFWHIYATNIRKLNNKRKPNVKGNYVYVLTCCMVIMTPKTILSNRNT